jgi:cytochrome c551/c552
MHDTHTTMTIDEALAKAEEYATKADRNVNVQHIGPAYAAIAHAYAQIATVKATQELTRATSRAANGVRAY